MQAMIYFQNLVLIVIVLLVIIIPSDIVLTITNNYFDNTNFAYGQTNQTISNNANQINIQNIPVKKVRVGDINIAYKTFGKGDPILLLSGSGLAMDQWQHKIIQ